MPILAIRLVTTTHHYRPGRVRRPPNDAASARDEVQKVREAQLEITPGPQHLTWTRDFFGNHVATARFTDRASVLRLGRAICVEKAAAGLRTSDILEFARTCPFTFAAQDRRPWERVGPSRHDCRG